MQSVQKSAKETKWGNGKKTKHSEKGEERDSPDREVRSLQKEGCICLFLAANAALGHFDCK